MIFQHFVWGHLMHDRLFGNQALKFRRFILCVAFSLVFNGCNKENPWRLHEISGHLPDLRFSLLSDTGQPLTEQTSHGYLVMLFFGFTNCQSECPTTLFRLSEIVQELGADANRTRILFVTLDPCRDTPHVMHRYLTSFDAEHAIGLIGNEDQIEELAKRYRIAYRRKDPGSGDIAHSAAVYVFDPQGHARLLITPNDPIEAVVNDLRRLLESAR